MVRTGRVKYSWSKWEDERLPGLRGLERAYLKFLLYCKPKWQHKADRRELVGASEGLEYRSVQLVSLANDNWYEVDSKTFLLSDKAL